MREATKKNLGPIRSVEAEKIAKNRPRVQGWGPKWNRELFYHLELDSYVNWVEEFEDGYGIGIGGLFGSFKVILG